MLAFCTGLLGQVVMYFWGPGTRRPTRPELQDVFGWLHAGVERHISFADAAPTNDVGLLIADPLLYLQGSATKTTSTPQVRFTTPQIPSNGDHKALNTGPLRGLGKAKLLSPALRLDPLDQGPSLSTQSLNPSFRSPLRSFEPGSKLLT